ncbi:cysteine-tRNA ligase [Anncaliia algerae PRA109]|nr:cysteine-tRNA ligase [Anncaliia algerae PRA109]
MSEKEWKQPIPDKQVLKLFNSITKRKDEFIAKKDNKIKWYACGPTVYDSAHIGHARTYISFDIIRSVLENYFGYDVNYTMNITDIDDKIIKKANEEGVKDTRIITKKYEHEFFEDLKALNVKYPTFVTRVTDYLEKINLFIEELESKGYAYESNGSVYFDLQKYKTKFKYPIFVPAGAIDESETDTEKKNKTDFVLWKKAKENEPSYPSKWGKGRPGWHIECSVMASDILGELDIHSGGIDLAFPHHENEIIQSQSYLDCKQWVNYFLHTGHLHIQGCKMSKSLKNFITIKDMLKDYTPREIRMLFLIHNWNTDMEYSVDAMEYSKKVEQKIINFISTIESRIKNYSDILEHSFSRLVITDNNEAMKVLEDTQSQIHASLCNNIDTQKSINALLELINFVNKRSDIAKNELILISEYVKKILKVFGIVFSEEKFKGNDTKLSELLCNFRNEVRLIAKKNKNLDLLKLCDEVRNNLKEMNFIIEDDGTKSIIREKL